MNENYPRRGHGRRRGRQRIERIVDPGSNYWCYAPVCRESTAGSITLRYDEVELLKMIDLEGLHQEEAAAIMGVSRKTVWRDLHEARRKLVDALVNGRAIEITGCDGNADHECVFFKSRLNQDEIR
jgi:predicted DNA-binding protein (UPF0251 family)